MIEFDWTEDELDAWRPPERMTVSEWAERNRFLSGRESAEPGKWDNARTPHLVDIMNAGGDPFYELIAVKKPAQMGVSESTRNIMGYWIDQDPGPCMLVYPTELSCREQIEERIKPLVKGSLENHITENAHDLKLTKLSLRSMDIYAAWASSPQRLASRPVRYIVLDEINKFNDWSGKDADPIALATARTRTYGRRAKIIMLSTPTIPEGHISKAFDRCEEQRRYVIPCMECGSAFDPNWSCVVWPKREDEEPYKAYVARIDAEQLARLRCPSCKFEHTETQRQRIIKHGYWQSNLPEGQRGRTVGFSFTSLISPWVNLSKLAAKFLKAKDNPAKLQEFLNQDLGEDFVQEQGKVDFSHLKKKRECGYVRGVVPKWAGSVIVGADTQKGGFWWSAVAVGHGSRMRIIDYGFAYSLDDLESKTLKRDWPIEGWPDLRCPTGMLCIDARGGMAASETGADRTDQVLRWSMTDPRIKPMMGTSRRSSAPIKNNNTNYSPIGSKNSYRVIRHSLDVHYFKDVLHSRITSENGDHFELVSDIDDEAMMQLSSEHRILVKKRNKLDYIWAPKTKNRANHLWDILVYVCAGMVLGRADSLPNESDLEAQRAAEQQNITQSRTIVQTRRNDKEAWVNGSGWWD